MPTYAEDTTDLCHVSDCARAIVLLQTADKLSDRVYNIGGGRATSNQEIAEAIERAVPGSDVASALTPGRGPQYQEDRYMDLSRIRTDVGYEPQVSLDEGISAYVEWLRDARAVAVEPTIVAIGGGGLVAFSLRTEPWTSICLA